VNIESSIRHAFATGREPPSLLFATANDEGAGEILTKSRWENIRPEQLRMHSAAVSFLTPSAFAYYLPAFMLSSLAEPGVRDSLLNALVPPKGDVSRPSFTAWWSLLSELQKAAVLAFIDYCLDEGYLYPGAAVDALKSTCGPNTSLERTREG
jgi:hypothetical protein